MIAILLILLITLTAGALAIYGLWYAFGKREEKAIQPFAAHGLFDDAASEDDAARIDEKLIAASMKKEELIERARLGDTSALTDAHATGDSGLYKEALDALLEKASESQESLSALVSHIAKSNELRASTKLAERLFSDWKARPTRRSTIEMLHVAALSDDAGMYQKAVEEVVRLHQDGKLSIADEDLLALVESEFWVLASGTRLGGAGFQLKRTLADVRRKLATATPAR